jgi:pimeloyl-ACP methyl ester carboxylesterase
MRLIYCIWTVLAFFAATVPAAGQAPTQPPKDNVTTTPYTIFLRGFPVGREDVTVRTDTAGTWIRSTGLTQGASPTVLQNVEFRYDPAGLPELFVLDSTVNKAPVTFRTRFKDGSAVTEANEQGKAASYTQKVSERPLVIFGGVFGGFAAFPPVLSKLSPGQTFRMLFVPSAEVEAQLVGVTDEQMQSGFKFVPVKRYEVTFADATATTTFNVVASAEGTLVRVTIPSQGIDMLRSDFASATSRTDVFSNPGDQAVIIPVTGFNLGATITVPKAAAPAGNAEPARLPAVVLLAGSGAPDREGVAPGVPVMGQLAGILAEAGFISVRYDRRGSGQSGGRAESATISDYAEDARAVVRWLTNRKDVDPRRIAIVGHGEGAWIAFLAASRDDRVAAVVSLASAASTGSELFLEQQQLQLGTTKLDEKERDAKVALQKQIQSAVLTGKGWEQVPEDVKRDADTPWFQSLLKFDPARVASDIDAPILVVHGDLDREVPVAHAERLAAIAQKGDSESVELVTVRGVNHIMLSAFTGEVSEYPTLTERTISKDISGTVAAWLTKTLPAPPARGR